jgi:hypothetical protein
MGKPGSAHATPKAHNGFDLAFLKHSSGGCPGLEPGSLLIY